MSSLIVTMTIILSHGYSVNCDLDHMQDVDISKGVDRDGDYDNVNDDKMMNMVMVILT